VPTTRDLRFEEQHLAGEDFSGRRLRRLVAIDSVFEHRRFSFDHSAGRGTGKLVLLP